MKKSNKIKNIIIIKIRYRIKYLKIINTYFYLDIIFKLITIYNIFFFC